MIVITGAAGFIGSYLAGYLNALGYRDLALVDDFSPITKKPNWQTKSYACLIDRTDFLRWLSINHEKVSYIFHLGAKTDTTILDTNLLTKLNLQFTKDLWVACTNFGIPLLYASSAATYGLGEYGFDDDESRIHLLTPLNPYGQSKQDFDTWALAQENKPFQWVGLKFFNVYGPNEHHKGRMASVVWHTYKQIKATGEMKLFKSHRADFKDGSQSRDFIFVDDIAQICTFFMHNRKCSGIFNAGTGIARSFFDLASATFDAIGLEPKISFIDTPLDIRDKYQYFTQANIKKLRSVGYLAEFTSLESGVKNYVKNYLTQAIFA